MLLRSLLVFCLACPALASQPNPTFETLVTRGLALPGGNRIKLPAPSMADGLDAAAQQKVLQAIAGERPVAALLRRGVSAPVIFDSGDLETATNDDGSVKFVNFWFIVYADLTSVAVEEFWRGQAAGSDPNEAPNPNDAKISGKLLTSDELQARKIETTPVAGVAESYGSFDLQLFNRLRVRGVTRASQTQSPESVTCAAILDPRFAGDAELPNQWQSLTRDDAGKLHPGPWKPYQGLGAYAKATQLKEPNGGILVEYHMLFHEPRGWFGGANVIRSKLPIVVQDNVKKLRRRVSGRQAGS